MLPEWQELMRRNTLQSLRRRKDIDSEAKESWKTWSEEFHISQMLRKAKDGKHSWEKSESIKRKTEDGGDKDNNN